MHFNVLTHIVSEQVILLVFGYEGRWACFMQVPQLDNLLTLL